MPGACEYQDAITEVTQKFGRKSTKATENQREEKIENFSTYLVFMLLILPVFSWLDHDYGVSKLPDDYTGQNLCSSNI